MRDPTVNSVDAVAGFIKVTFDATGEDGGSGGPMVNDEGAIIGVYSGSDKENRFGLFRALGIPAARAVTRQVQVDLRALKQVVAPAPVATETAAAAPAPAVPAPKEATTLPASPVVRVRSMSAPAKSGDDWSRRRNVMARNERSRK